MRKRRTYTNDPVRPSEKTIQECFQELDQAIREFKLALAHSLGLDRVVDALAQFIDRRRHAKQK